MISTGKGGMGALGRGFSTRGRRHLETKGELEINGSSHRGCDSGLGRSGGAAASAVSGGRGRVRANC